MSRYGNAFRGKHALKVAPPNTLHFGPLAGNYSQEAGEQRIDFLAGKCVYTLESEASVVAVPLTVNGPLIRGAERKQPSLTTIGCVIGSVLQSEVHTE